MKNDNLTKRQEQAIKTKNKIFKKAIALMEKKGFNNITIEEISKAAGVSIGAFYHYYKSKNDIFFELYKNADEYFQKVVSKELREENSLNRVIEYFKYYARYTKNGGIDTAKLLYNPDNKWFIKKGRYMQVLIQEIIESGQKNSEIRSDMTSEELTGYLFIAARGVVYDWCLHDGEYELETAMEKFFSRFIRLIT